MSAFALCRSHAVYNTHCTPQKTCVVMNIALWTTKLWCDILKYTSGNCLKTTRW